MVGERKSMRSTSNANTKSADLQNFLFEQYLYEQMIWIFLLIGNRLKMLKTLLFPKKSRCGVILKIHITVAAGAFNDNNDIMDNFSNRLRLLRTQWALKLKTRKHYENPLELQIKSYIIANDLCSLLFQFPVLSWNYCDWCK